MNHGQQPGIPNMVGISPSNMMASSPQQQMPGMMGPQQNPAGMAMPGPQPQPHATDNISKVKSLIGPLREALATTLKLAATLLQHNSITDNGNLKNVDNNNAPPRFDKNLEEFYSVCDQIELHLKTAIQCMQQSSSSQRYLPVPVASTRIEPIMPPTDGPISYSQYLSVVRSQIASSKEIHDTLICAAQNICPSE
ncbi:Mediator of RNA polymerase II transcription subunit 29 [Pseudolycoriella hygida]|uniref:Mediator of RNA polymerase II transcription subunit 29 n=1 Tax=Pseudolycoriella hygida TaxID=35572 RepID=A0A9Q0SAH9_9DIPT|nr:Mediator of RNA polymerase II transcription subunit 29 [Pseudolycoriella hygida]